MNLPSKWKPILIRLSEAMILMVALLAAWVLWLWLADDGGFEAIYVAIAALLGGLMVVRRWLKQAGAETGTRTAVPSQLINWRQAAPTSKLSTLRQQIETHFDLDELRILAFDLGLNYENLGGEMLTHKTHALVEVCQRHGRLPDLITHLRQNRPQVEWAAPVAQPLTNQAQRLREKLLNRVETIWIEGVLRQSIHTEILRLTMSYRPEATGQRAWQLVLKQKGEDSQTVPPERSLLDIFNRSGRDLLILGDPGSGKTTTMLQLAQALIAEAHQDPTTPMPLVLNLSSWAQQRSALTDWLVQEVANQYGLARDLIRTGVEQNQFLYLLDGLDEVPDSKDRAACLEAINEFKAVHIADMVICSRTVEYEMLSNQLAMGTAVQIQPLTDEQIDAYLSHEGLELQAVRAMLAHDQPLKELAQTPLLLGLMTLAYRGSSLEELKPLTDKEARRRHLFDHYVNQMFDRRPLLLGAPCDHKQAINWLIDLARGMVQHKLSVFHIEQLQPTWLPNSRWIFYYDSCAKLATILIASLAAILLGVLIGGLTNELGISLIAAFVGAVVGWIAGSLNQGLLWKKQGRAVELFEQMVLQLPTRTTLQAAFKKGLFFGLIFGLLGGLLSVLIVGWLGGMQIGLGVGLLTLLSISTSIWLISCTQTFIRAQKVEQRIQPNQGIWHSGSNGLKMSLLFMAIGSLSVILSAVLVSTFGFELNYMLTGGIAGAVSGGYIGGFLIYGGLTFIQHYILRCLLGLANRMPAYHLIAFLDAMHERILLRRVGGGWIFIHRSLLEYFASLPVETERQGHFQPHESQQ